MTTVAIGGNSRSVGKTSLAVSIISALPEMEWTAVKVTQFGHGICSHNGEPCACAITSPNCPFQISLEDGSRPGSDTARMLEAGAAEALWVRVAMGQLGVALPALRERLAGRRGVVFESNSIVQHWKPDLYLAVLQYDEDDCKTSTKLLAPKANAFVLPPSSRRLPAWQGFDTDQLKLKPVFRVSPPSYFSAEVFDFIRSRAPVS